MELHALPVLQIGKEPPLLVKYETNRAQSRSREGKSCHCVSSVVNLLLQSLYRLRYSVGRTDLKYGMNTGDRRKHSTVNTHGLLCRDELWRRHQSQLRILGGGGRLHSEWIDQSRPLSQRACFCYEDLWAEVHTCSLEVWACHGSESYKQHPDSLPTRTFTFPTRMVLKLRRPNFKRTVRIYISICKNVLALKTRLLPYAALCSYFKRRKMSIR